MTDRQKTDWRDATRPVLRALTRRPDTLDGLTARLTRYTRDAIDGAVGHLIATYRAHGVDWIDSEGNRSTTYYPGTDDPQGRATWLRQR